MSEKIFIDFSDLSGTRKKWVEVNRENGFEDGIKQLLTDLYPDNAHFIYELLQNAEDALATEVKFSLTEEKIVFEHNGDRLFTLANVISITSIGKSSKRDDPTVIGKFGVGFKSVFAYTNTPYIYSGDFNFFIHDLVVPERIDSKSDMDKEATFFEFPFNNIGKKDKAAKEIEKGLLALWKNDSTLLFLKNIKKIIFTLPNSKEYKYTIERVGCSDMHNHISIESGKTNAKTILSDWLRFDSNISLVDEEESDNENKTKKITISIAYKIKHKEKNDKEWEVVPCEPGNVSIYFPAEKETSNLNFHLNAPFASTVARDSVRDCNANDRLRDEIKKLVLGSLVIIKENKMLTMNFLKVLPNPNDNLSKFYEPIRTAIVESFKTTELTPTKAGGYAPANTLRQGPAAISSLIGDDDLSNLIDKPKPLWAANAPQQSQRDDQFLSSLEINKWGWSDLIEYFNNCTDGKKSIIQQWLSKKDDKWMLTFYELLYKACDETKQHQRSDYTYQYKYHYFSNLNIVRISTSDGDKLEKPINTYFSTSNQHGLKDRFFVKQTVYTNEKNEQQDGAKKFLEKIGVKEYGEKVLIEERIKSYSKNIKEIDFNVDIYFSDIKWFISFFEKNSYGSKSIFTENGFLIGRKPNDDILYWCKPDSLCVDNPYLDTGLSLATGVHKKYILWDEYKNRFSENELKSFMNFLSTTGVMSTLSVREMPVRSNGYETQIDENYDINGIEDYLKLKSRYINRLIWNALIKAKKGCDIACSQINRNYNKQIFESKLVTTLKESEWIPNLHGVFCRPEDISRNELPDDFIYDNTNGLLYAIGFGAKAEKQSQEYQDKNSAANSIGFQSVEEAEKAAELSKILREKGISIESVLDNYKPNLKPEFPESSPSNSDRIREKIETKHLGAPDKKYEIVETSKRTSTGTIDKITYIKAKYTNDDKIMVCQLCHDAMPFKKKNGEYYFESVEMLSNAYFSKEDEHQYLCLCPVCSAKYKEFILENTKTNSEMDDIKSKILDLNEDVLNPEISIKLGYEEMSIRFVKEHFIALKTILNVENSEKGENDG